MKDGVLPGYVVQVAPGASHWADAFFVTITEVREWGIVGYTMIVNPDGKGGLAMIRLNHEQYALIGVAEWTVQDVKVKETP
jgi:hypothetical protein